MTRETFLTVFSACSSASRQAMFSLGTPACERWVRISELWERIEMVGYEIKRSC